jgi:hypothetical protein
MEDVVPKNLDSPVEWIFLALIVIVIAIGAIAAANAEQGLDDPNDTSRVFLDQVVGLALLAGAGPFRVTIFRQSGNVHAEHHADTAAGAVAQAISTFRRAGIDAVRISRNTSDELHFNRLFYDHRGSSEGKKVGSVEISRAG